MDSILDVYSELEIGNNSLIKADFIGKGNIWINNTYEPGVISFARYIIYEAINRTASGQLTILGYDSDLSGIFAPFALLSEGELKQLEMISDGKEFEKYLNYIRQQIQAVQNVIQGRSESLIDFRASINRPVESYKLIVLSLDMGLIEQNMRAKLALLMRSGPKYGVSFLIISTTYMSVQMPNGREVDLSVGAIASNITVFEVNDNFVSILGNKTEAAYISPTAESIVRGCERLIEDVKQAKLPLVCFNELHAMSEIWTMDSTESIRFFIGKYGVNDMEITIGDEVNQRHNAIITGAVGQGKSNLISVIIHSLCLRYSPWQLRLYLLDFKEGVTFKAFSNIGQEEYLPHARALGLESDIEFGLAVLKSLYGEYQRRMRILKENSAKSIRELRKRLSDIEMPRILVIIDEFQMMFGNDMQIAQEIADLLEKSVRLFRAAGIHFILASQTLGGNMALAQRYDSIFGQIPIRIALKNSVSESQQTLSINNSAAAFLHPREAIVNLDYGELSQNRKTVIAYADEVLLKPLRKIWWDRAKAAFPPPYIFESERRFTISSAVKSLLDSRKSKNVPFAIVGDRISIDGEHIVLPMSDEPGHNIAVIGTPDIDCNQAIGMIQSIAVCLAVQDTKESSRFLFCDFRENNISYDKKYPEFSSLMKECGHPIENIAWDEFEETILSLSRQETSNDMIYIFGVALDRWKYIKDSYGQGSSLKSFTESGPSKKMHFIGWWSKASNFTSQVAGYGGVDAFNTKIFLRLEERAIQSFTNPFVRWSAQENRALVSDAIEFAEEIIFIPYAPITQEDVNIFRQQMWKQNKERE